MNFVNRLLPFVSFSSLIEADEAGLWIREILPEPVCDLQSIESHPIDCPEGYLAICTDYLRTHAEGRLISEVSDHTACVKSYSLRLRYPWARHVPFFTHLNYVASGGYPILSEHTFNPFEGEFSSYMASIATSCYDAFASEWVDDGSESSLEIARLSGVCVAESMNRLAWNLTSPPIHYEPSGPNEINAYSVNDLISKKAGSCTSLSIFLVNSLRAVGMPARVAGVPHWVRPECGDRGDKDPMCGNHNWVEAFIPTMGWSFIDQANSTSNSHLNTAWFFPEPVVGTALSALSDGAELHAVYASSFASPFAVPQLQFDDCEVAADHFPLVFDEKAKVNAFNVTSCYASPSRPSIQNEALYILSDV